MRKWITTIALLALVDTSVAIAQTAGSPNPAAPQSANGQPIGAEWRTGRPPPAARRSGAFGENLMDPNDPVNRENAALDHLIKGICRGC
jgi:hypothetical protein